MPVGSVGPGGNHATHEIDPKHHEKHKKHTPEQDPATKSLDTLTQSLEKTSPAREQPPQQQPVAGPSSGSST